MHLIKSDPELSFLVGRKVSQLSISQFQVSLGLENSSSMDCKISTEGDWRLTDKGDNSLEENQGSDNIRESKLPLLLNQTVESYGIISPNVLRIEFENYGLELFCEESPYENFQIYFGKIVVVY